MGSTQWDSSGELCSAALAPTLKVSVAHRAIQDTQAVGVTASVQTNGDSKGKKNDVSNLLTMGQEHHFFSLFN